MTHRSLLKHSSDEIQDRKSSDATYQLEKLLYQSTRVKAVYNHAALLFAIIYRLSSDVTGDEFEYDTEQDNEIDDVRDYGDRLGALEGVLEDLNSTFELRIIFLSY